MKLFSEKVTPTFTSSNQNILTIKEFNEIFFDVYELEINGNKYIAEKISEYKGNPVVNIPVVIDGKEFEAPFVLQTGKLDIIFNERNSTFIGSAKPESVEVYDEVKSREEEVEEIIFEKRESILEEIQQARQLASQFAEDIKQEKIRAADVRLSKDKAAIINTANKFKSELVDEFLAITENTRSELYTYTQDENKKSHDFIVDTVTQLAEKLTQDLNDEVEIQTTKAISVFEEKIDKLARNILTEKLLKTISHKSAESDKKIDLKFETVSKTIAKVLGDYEVQLNDDVKLKLENFDSQILTLEKNSVDLNNTITKNTNKALSRIGNVKTQLEEAIVNVSVTLSDELTSKITLAESKIKDYYDERITLVESSITDITAQERAHILNVIQESKQSILDEVSQIKTSVPSVIVEKTREPKGEADIQKIKTDLEKTISNRFTQELANVRRIIELSSGGGSVAVQFANGGTMNGDLVVTGNTTTNTLTVNNGSNITGGLSADRIYTTQLDALSANITVIDIKQYELSGFNVQGDCTIQGSVSASGSVTANNLVYKGGNTEGAALTIGTNDAQNLNFETNGSTRMSITSAGNVGIGTTTPQQSIDLRPIPYVASQSGGIRFDNTSGAWPCGIYIRSDSSGNPRLSLDAPYQTNTLNLYNNLVGIGTTTPTQKLTVVGNISASGSVTANNLVYKGGNTEGAALTIGTNDAQDLNFETNGSIRMSITSAGNVGIGTTTPATKLHIYDSLNAHLKIVSADTSGSIRKLSLERSTGGAEIHFNEDTRVTQGLTLNTTNAAYPMSFQINGNTKMFVSTTGNVGIGTTVPTQALTVVGNISATGNLSASDIYSNGNRVATVVDPARTSLTGNGILSTFNLSGASGIVNPSALIVAIDGAMQEPVADYTVSNGQITFTSPLANGSKAVVISPTNTLQVSQMIPADGTVTSAKLDTNLSLAGSLTIGGQTQLASTQEAIDSDSAMTRGLSLAEEAFNINGYGFGSNTSGGNQGTGSSQARSGSTATGFGRTVITSNVMRSGASGAAFISSSVPVAAVIFGSVDVQAGLNGGVMRLIVGDTGVATGVPPRFGGQDALIARGFGAEVFYSTLNSRQEIRLFAHNGTDYVTSAGVAFPNTYQGSHTILVSSDGQGTIKLFAHNTGSAFIPPQRPTLYATLNGGPSGGTVLGGNHITVVCVNEGTVAPTAGDALFSMVRSKFIVGAVI